MSRPTTWAAAAVLLILLGGGTATATLLVPMTDADLVASSDLIAIGTVGDITTAVVDGGRVVTRITLAVERPLKGAPSAATIVITEPGGRLPGMAVVVLGAPEFARGERVLVFLRVRSDGTLSTTALALGKYRVEASAIGALVARRTRPRVDERPLETFSERIVALAGPGTTTDGRTGAAVSPTAIPVVTDEFAFSGSPPARWFEADCGTPIAFSRANAEETFGDTASRDALLDATAAWTVIENASIAVTVGPDSVPAPSLVGGTFDGKNTVQFNDPFDEVADIVNCSGVFGRGGFVSSFDEAKPALSKTVGGITFARILEGDVTLNQGVGACASDPSLIAEVTAHEIGHAIGFSHSSEDPLEADPTLADALMYYRAHDDGRGAAVRADDIAAATTSYPSELVATTPIAALACHVTLGLNAVPCFGETLSATPFARFEKARGLVTKAASAPTAKKQKKLLKKALALLGKTDKAIVQKIQGACGEAMRAIVVARRQQLTDVLAGL